MTDVRSFTLLGKLLFLGRYLEHVGSWSTWHTILVLLFSDFCFFCPLVFLLPSISLAKHFTILVKDVLIIAVSHTTIADVHLYFHLHTVVDCCHSYYSNSFLVIYRMKRKIRKIEQGVNFIKKFFCCFLCDLLWSNLSGKWFSPCNPRSLSYCSRSLPNEKNFFFLFSFFFSFAFLLFFGFVLFFILLFLSFLKIFYLCIFF